MMVATQDPSTGSGQAGLQYLLTDHLGSTVAVTNSSGTLTSQQRYLPFGEVRQLPNYPTIQLTTDFGYTGQRLLDEDMGGIMDYRARFFAPYLNHFTQPDTLVSNPYNPQAWNRYAYTLNNPIRYNDPTGHVACSSVAEEDCSFETMTAEEVRTGTLISKIRSRYNWYIVGDDWTSQELQTIYETGRDIEAYVDDLTDGMGQEWMNEYLGRTNIQHWSGENNQTWPWWAVGKNTIYLKPGGYNAQTFAHELGHVWDINTGGVCICGAINGVGDSLNTFIGGSIAGTWSSRYDNYWGKPADPNIQSINVLGMLEIVQFNSGVNNGYGNGSTADYLAESFSWNVVDRQNVPIAASVWVDQTIIAQAAGLP